MTHTTTDIDRPELRRTVRNTIRDRDTVTRSTLVEAVAAETNAPNEAVNSELDALEREGFVYLVGDDDPEVRLP
jgi:uncharacterized protein YgbK (DUF1537 family)